MMLSLLAAFLGLLVLASGVDAQQALTLKTQKEKMSYIIGMDIGKNFKNQSVDVDPRILAKGIKDVISGKKSLLTEQEIRETMAVFQKEMGVKQQALGEKNKKEGEAFLAENKKKKDVIILPSGLQYKVIKTGTGEKPNPTDTVTVNYQGTLIDGTVFDSSYRHGKPATISVNGVIPGWTEALGLMQEGAKWRLFIPSDLAYGEKGVGGQIGSNATVIFEVELISIVREGVK